MEIPYLSAKTVALKAVGVPFAVGGDYIGEIVKAWEHRGEVMVRVKFNDLGRVLRPDLPEVIEFVLKRSAWSFIYQCRLREM